MSYGDVRQNRTVALGAVVAVHAALAYALLTGLATDMIHQVVPERTIIYDVPLPDTPPPEAKPRLEKATTSTVITAPTRTILPPTDSTFTTSVTEIDPGPIVEATPGPAVEPAPPPPPSVSLARGAAPRGNQGDWFPADSYPASAQRAGAEGLVSVRVGVGANGRVTDCAVTASSGNAALDEATCRLAKRNGRFEAARGADGQPTTVSYTLRNVRWRLVE